MRQSRAYMLAHNLKTPCSKRFTQALLKQISMTSDRKKLRVYLQCSYLQCQTNRITRGNLLHKMLLVKNTKNSYSTNRFSIEETICLFVCQSVCLTVCLSVRLSVFLSVCLTEINFEKIDVYFLKNVD